MISRTPRRISQCRSLIKPAFRAMIPLPICHCCVLNRISFLRNTSDPYAKKISTSREQSITAGDSCCAAEVSREERVTSAISVNSYPSDKIIVWDDSSKFMLPEGLIDEQVVKLSDSFIVVESCMKTKYTTASTNDYNDRSILVQRIASVLQEQKKFFESLNVSVCDIGGIQPDNKYSNIQFASKGDSGKTVSCNPTQMNRVVFFTSDDQVNVTQMKTDKQAQKMTRKPLMFLTDKPSKLPMHVGNVSKELLSLNDASVKILFFPESVIKGSSSSIEYEGLDSRFVDSGSNSSAYVTAANSCSEAFSRALFAAADKVCQADSREVLEIN